MEEYDKRENKEMKDTDFIYFDKDDDFTLLDNEFEINLFDLNL